MKGNTHRVEARTSTEAAQRHAAQAPEEGGGDSALPTRHALADAARRRGDVAETAVPLGNARADTPSHRDLMFAARLLEVENASSLTRAELLDAVSAALRQGMDGERLEHDLHALVEALQVAGRPTAANEILATWRDAA